MNKQSIVQYVIYFAGISPYFILTIALSALKLLTLIDWSWIWVLSPLWLPISIAFGFIVIWMTVSMLIDLFTQKWRIR